MIEGARLVQYAKLMRLDKPIGILLLLWPTLWALWISADGRPNLRVVIIFVIGTVLMRSAGCAINDYADRDFDRQVARTKSRPLAAGRVSPQEAVLLATGLSLLAFILILPLNRLTIALSLPALLLAAGYPFTKRFFVMPQAILGVAFGFGIPMAFAAQTGAVPFLAWLLLLANIFWAIAYDTEYAMVDRADDVKIGIKTSAITFGRFEVAAVMLCHGLFLSLLAAVGLALKLSAPFFLGLLGATGLVLRQYRWISGRSPERCFQAFLNNNWIGALIFCGIAADYALAGGA